jgi:hypothetical protein
MRAIFFLLLWICCWMYDVLLRIGGERGREGSEEHAWQVIEGTSNM